MKYSPSSINCYYTCPRKFYYNYVKKIRGASSLPMVKGSVVHKVLELFFIKYNKNLKKHILNIFEKEWKKTDLSKFEEKDIENSYNESLLILKSFVNKFNDKINILLATKKIQGESHGFYLLRPKFRELRINDEELNMVGIIDRVDSGFGEGLTITDYKTGSMYAGFLPDDIRRQMSIYALLYYRKEKVAPKYIFVEWLRYGERFPILVTPSMLKYAENTIKQIKTVTKSISKKDYPKTESDYCFKFCDVCDYCTGKKVEKEEQKDLKEIFLKDDEKKNTKKSKESREKSKD